jgi:predicted metal-dependent hydrolase
MEFKYGVKRSASRRKVTITVERDRSVVVHTPTGVSDEQIDEIVMSKRLWIFEKLSHEQKLRDLPHPPGKELVNGESALYLGRLYQVEVVDTDTAEVQFSGRFVIPRSFARHHKRVLRDWYIRPM